jgi:hypothetical protein
MHTDARAGRRPRQSGGNDEWRHIVETFRRSGLSRRAFCEETTVPLSTLNWWLTRARREAAVPAPMAFAEVRLPLASPSSPLCSSTQTWAMEIVTREGVTIRWRDIVSLSDLVAMLHGA